MSPDRNLLIVGILLILGFLLGGGGAGAGLANLAVQLAAILVLALHPTTLSSFFRKSPRHVAVLVGVTVLLPLLQCIPLPSALWHMLPGRQLAEQSLQIVGHRNDWMPMSLNVRRTLVAFLSLLPPLTILILTTQLQEHRRPALLALLVACGVFEVLLGAQQMALGNRHLMFYSETIGTPDLQGVFANRNTAGLFLNITLCALIGLLMCSRVNVVTISVTSGVGLLLLAGLFLTRSRSSMVLGVIPFILLVHYLWSFRAHFRVTGLQRTLLAAVAGLLSILILIAVGNERLQGSLSRFDHLEDARPAIWEDAISSAKRFWPIGAGVGSFDDVFQVDEALENVGPGRAGRAHNDYLEVLIESGGLGGVLVVSWIGTIFFAISSGIRGSQNDGGKLAAAAIFTLLAFQSVLDYPLRSEAMLCVAGLMLAFLLPASLVQARERE
ncbi:O-antigen ligase family protein [Novosphingobium resinovorum]|uniref:O-antigen ligase family protein n=1 Tax=Novosphingobium resinovorum TaxID=158500 RepID=UPI003605DEF9